ncbi:MAG: HEAT repeat domain-containing protein [Planctomycetota bacterium]
MHAAFCALVTGQAAWREKLSEQLRRVPGWYAGLVELGKQDTDPWIHSAKMMRLAIALDWAWDLDAVDEAERDGLVDLVLRDAFENAFVALHRRVPPHANNQGLALALHLAVTGYVFGVRRGQDPLARRLLEYGLHHLPMQIGLLPPGGYSGEGSTYLAGVADPLTVLACAFIEAITGEPWFERQIAPSGNSFKQVLRLNRHLRTPSGLLLPWNQHGFQRRGSGLPAAYWAHQTGDASVYAKHLAEDGWELGHSFAWFDDSHLWEFIFMPPPDELEAPETTPGIQSPGTASYQSWREDMTAAALVSPDQHHQLAQAFNVVGSMPARLHVHPNMVHLESWGSPLTVDGNSHEGFPLSTHPDMQWTHYYSQAPKQIDWSQGSIAAHSCVYPVGHEAMISPDQSFGYAPEDTPLGRVTHFEPNAIPPGAHTPTLASDVTAFFRHLLDAQRISRASAWVDDRCWVIEDRIDCDTPHEWAWQLVTRPGASKTAYGARLMTAEAVVLDIVDLDGHAAELVDVPGYPTSLEGHCQHYRKQAASSLQTTFRTALIPQLGRELVEDWTDGWTGTWREGTDQENTKPSETDGEPIAFAHVFYRSADHAGQTLVLQRPCDLDSDQASDGLLLELPRASGMRCFIDGIELSIPEMMSHTKEPRLVAPFLDLQAAASARQFTVELHLPIDGPTPVLGHARLHRRIDPSPPQVEYHEGQFELRIGDHTTSFDWRRMNHGSEPVAADLPQGEALEQVEAQWLNALPPAAVDEVQTKPMGRETLDRLRRCLATPDRQEPHETRWLIQALNDPERIVQLAAASALGHIKEPQAAAALRDKLAEEIENAEGDSFGHGYGVRLREMCIISLERLGDRQAAPLIASCLRDGEFYGVRRLAANALGRVGDASYIPTLEAWQNDFDPETAFAAKRQITKLAAVN